MLMFKDLNIKIDSGAAVKYDGVNAVMFCYIP